MNDLNKLRERIDWLDSQIATLLNERMMAADQVGKIKRSAQQEIADPNREESVLNRLEKIVQHPVLKANIANIYEEIMKASRTAQQFYIQTSQPFHRIGIVGIGLMGGSICKALKTKDPSLNIGSVKHASSNSQALESKLINKEYDDISDLVQNSDLIIIATPISTVISLADKIKKFSDNHTKLIVIDIASVKKEIVQVFAGLTEENIEFVGTHPMAGKEQSGFSNSQSTLFVNRPWVITPHTKNDIHTLENIHEFIRFLGGSPILLDAETHDQQVALISHLPSLISKSYFDFVNAVDPNSMDISGPGFHSFTRLAHDNPQMLAEIATSNHPAIQYFLDQWLEYLKNNSGVR